MGVDRLHEQALDLRQRKYFLCKSVKLGFGQNLCQRSDTFYGSATGNEMMRPFSPVAFFVVDDAVFELLFFVPILGKLRLGSFLFGSELFECFLFCICATSLKFIDRYKNNDYIFSRWSRVRGSIFQTR